VNSGLRYVPAFEIAWKIQRPTDKIRKSEIE